MQKILSEADGTVAKLSGEILDGEIGISPLSAGSKYDACKFCIYKGACGFDARAYGYKKRSLDGKVIDAGDTEEADDVDGNGEDE